MMYSVFILSPSTPAFVSVEDMIYVDDADVKPFCEFRRELLHGLYAGPDLVCDALSGSDINTDDEVCSTVPVIARKSSHVGDVGCEYLNVWGFTYSFEFRDVSLDLAWVDDAGCLRRVAKLRSKALLLDGRPVWSAMGEPGVVRFSDEGVTSMVHLRDAEFCSREEMLADIAEPCVRSDVSHVLETFLGHVVADG